MLVINISKAFSEAHVCKSDIYMRMEKYIIYDGQPRHIALALSKKALPTCCSDLLFAISSQSEESQLKEGA